jgi:hypothetical protein
MFASRITNTVTLPSDPSVTVTIRKLSWLQRQAAQQESQAKSSRALIAMGGAAVLEELRKMDTGAEAPKAPAHADPLLTHDQLTVLVSGIKAWSVPEPVTREHIEDLEPADAEHLARAILELSLPSATQEADRKNAD